jgi:formylglycine-generating enzyme
MLSTLWFSARSSSVVTSRPSSPVVRLVSALIPLAVGAATLGACADAPTSTSPSSDRETAALTRLPLGFQIDQTEVTRDQYAAWLATRPSVSEQAGSCQTNESFAPDARCLQQYDGFLCADGTAGCGDHPQTCVDWCDAKAYCEASGKRLCGAVGGGELPFTDPAATGDLQPTSAPVKGEWELACSAGGTTRFPYGDEAKAEACNTVRAGHDATTAVGAMAACRSSVEGYRDLVDLSGNVWEWENACAGEGDDAFCQVRGGSFVSDEKLDSCAAPHRYARDFKAFYVGIRCCAD